MNPSILRAIDANLNRAREGLRVVEEVFRFVQEDRHLSSICKSIRHDLQTWAANFDQQDLLACRDAASDVGQHQSQDSEYQRKHIVDLLRANFGRCQQAMRVLEEFSKTENPSAAADIESIRFRIYELEKAAVLSVTHCQQLQDIHLYVLIDCQRQPEQFESYVRCLCENGIRAIQLRDKTADDHKLLNFGKLLVDIANQHATLAIINDRADIAAAIDAHGVHVGQDDLSVSQARSVLGTGKLIGVSTHDLTQARQAVLDGASYIGCGPTFPSLTKSFDQFAGLEFLEQVAAEISLPAFAIGGITSDNFPSVLQTGFRRAAISSALNVEPDKLPAAIQSFETQLEQTRPSDV